jgi:hypothetical protein
MSQATAWRIIAFLSIVAAGAALGDERPREPSQYFWDLSSYVTALDADNPYKSDAFFAFLYPPVAADLFKLTRSHLFELMSIAYVGAIVGFLAAFARLEMPRRLEWFLAITAMGGLGVVSLKTGNVAIVMNFTLLALLIDAATGRSRSLQLLPVAIAVGALIKPQFLLYLGLLPVLERSRKTAVIEMLAVALIVIGVHASYVVFRPNLWSDYVTGVGQRTLNDKDFGWGAAALAMHFTGSTTAALAGFVGGLLIVGALAYLAWQRSARREPPISPVSLGCLTFIVLTFANPRVPLYDLYAAGIALCVCCGLAARAEGAWAMAVALAINLMPWLIANFARNPSAYPWWTSDYLITHIAGLALLLGSLARTGLAPMPVYDS